MKWMSLLKFSPTKVPLQRFSSVDCGYPIAIIVAANGL
jgi:hypothetical protein